MRMDGKHYLLGVYLKTTQDSGSQEGLLGNSQRANSLSFLYTEEDTTFLTI